FDPFGGLDLANAHLDLEEVFDGNLAVGRRGCRFSRRYRRRSGSRRCSLGLSWRRCRCARSLRCWSRSRTLLFHLLHPFNGGFICAWKHRLYFAQLAAERKLSPLEVGEIEFGNIAQPELFPDFRG